MKTKIALFGSSFLAALLLAGAGVGHAQATGNITSATTTSANGTSINLNDSTAFAGFQTTFPAADDMNDGNSPVAFEGGSVEPGTNTGAAFTDSNNVANFSSLAGGQDNERYAGPSTSTGLAVTYTNSNNSQATNSGFTGTPTSQTGNLFFIGTYNETESETSTLFAPSEVYNFYIGVSGYQTEGPVDDQTTGGLGLDTITATLTDASGATVGSYSGTLSPLSNGGQAFADLTLNITGAAVGDTLTFTQSDSDADLPYFTSSEAVYFSAITAEAAPEPSTFALVLGGLALLGVGVRRKLA